MKHRELWQPSKYVYRNGKLAASRDHVEVGVGSRLMVDLVAGFYDRNLPIHAKGRLLDLGCGKVPLFAAYSKLVTDNICVDWENSLHPNAYLDFECDITASLPFKDGEFDTIILSDVLEHIPQPERLMADMARMLSANGKLILNVPFFYWIHERPHDYYRYTEFALRRFVDGAGLKLLQLDAVGGSPEALADMLAKHLQFVPLLGTALAACVQFVARVFVGTSFGGKISRKTAEGFPLGYFLVAEKH